MKSLLSVRVCCSEALSAALRWFGRRRCPLRITRTLEYILLRVNFGGKRLILAPMAGITDTVFRALCRAEGADIVVSELVSAEAVLRGNPKCDCLTAFTPEQRPVGIQLFGADSTRMAEAARRIEQRFCPDFIDLNSGCPVPKIVRNNAGAALLRDPERFRGILSAMVKAVAVPVTVKIRSGWESRHAVDVEFARMATDCGAAAITLHPRSRSMGFSGEAQWGRIALVKEASGIPVVGNGGIRSGEDALRMLEETGCDSIMVGRAACGNPWIFGEIRAALAWQSPCPPSPRRKRETVLSHIRRYAREHGEVRAGNELKKHIAWYLKGTPGAASARDRIFRAAGRQELEEIVEGLWH